MKLQQLRYLIAISEHNLNITAAAERLHASQPGVSKQLKLLEEELGLQLFTRNGKALDGVTDAGRIVLDKANNIIREVNNIKTLANDLKNEKQGQLSIGTTHTQARYILPDVLQKFHAKYPKVTVNIHQGTTEQIADQMESGLIDFAIVSNGQDNFSNIVSLACYQWNRIIIVKPDHPLAQVKSPITLKDLSKFPLITYVFSAKGQSSFLQAFEEIQVQPNIALTARDADVIKTYVRKGLGVGIVAQMAFDAKIDDDLVIIRSEALFSCCTTWIGFRKDFYLRLYMYDFIEFFAPQLNREVVSRAQSVSQGHEVGPQLIDKAGAAA